MNNGAHRPPIDDLWYKNAIIYCLDVEKYVDSNGDGIGDFGGLTRRLDYLAGMGITCVWLQPFYPSPNRDNGYDVADYYGVHPKHGTLGEFVEFMNHAQQIGLRVIVDLVINHTSNRHPWFQSARKDPASPYRDWYVWSKTRPAEWNKGMVFPGVQKATWTRDPVADEYYFHRFYEFQPDLNTLNPAVQREMMRIMGFWLQLGVSGFRMDAVPFMIEQKGAGVTPRKDYEMLHLLQDFLQWRRRDAIFLAEANVPPDESMDYFGENGERIQMMLNFAVNQRVFYALATGDIKPLVRALEATYKRPPAAQWVNFLRSHDELDLGRLTDTQRERVFQAFAPAKEMQLYNRGIRRRLAPMLDNDRRKLELAFSLLFTLPGTPMLQFGDEIGLGDDLSLPERECARTPMQWSSDPHGGFTTAKRPVLPVISDPIYGYQRVNVEGQRRDPQSLLNWMERKIRMRRECPEISWGDWKILKTDQPGVLVMRYEWDDHTLVTLHNFTGKPCAVVLDRGAVGGDTGTGELVDLLATNDSRADENGRYVVKLQPYDYRWLRAGGIDRNVPR
ncbi:MAG: trehalose synthase [Deltaproteobacteria bacterium]|jgi:maltose alpha-D-glucosyltransferase/alpha-amylase|nr:trehalose synthase [Deltaproteobacteria bacterium]